MKFVDAYIEPGETDVRISARDRAVAFHVDLARARCSSPRHSYAWRVEYLRDGAWAHLETLPSLAHAIARIDAWPWFARRIVCEGVVLGECGTGALWFADAA